MSLDRIMIGFNGTSYSDPSDRAANPLLQDCGIRLAAKNPALKPRTRVISGVTVTSRDGENKIIAKGACGNLTAAVYDAKNSLMDEWRKRNPDNVVIGGRPADNRQFPGNQRNEPDQPEHRNAGRSADCRAGARWQYADLHRAVFPGERHP